MTWAIFSDAHRQGIAEMIQSGSDRVAVIVGGALLDDTLRRTLAERFSNDKRIADKLLKVNGPLGNAVPKVDVLYMLGAFDKPVRNALYGLFEIRNFFAHHLDASFASQNKQFLATAKKLTLHNGRKFYPHHIYDEDSEHSIEAVQNNGHAFIVNLKLCLIALMRDRVCHQTWSNKPLTKTALREQKRKWKKIERERKRIAS